MSSKSIQAVSKRSPTSHLFGPGKGKSLSHATTSASIANDIAAFKKRGGRIEILGNTPFRTHLQTAAFRSAKVDSQNKARAVAAGKAAAAPG